ncbi:two-partner secretion domain-containing protein [Variovorax guangxiensis]|uniref:Filamentous hemagglutinin family protein n=1 Tax=Variovorax guangxiensis TaxID=1775474 RepID=A0A840FXY0_9BURK|nr:filamentous hemagglutinin N-terminal domain-containing protein [Variovorax guangxiensis]MBB4223937.1 filamentous hemagglutinin family protein [Variovorax guangxiensis]
MNRHLHRIVFNAARGMRMVVQETATSTGKGSNKATKSGAGPSTGAAVLSSVLISAALASALAATPAHAQIVGAPNVPGNLRPTVLTAPNGVPLINVQTPSAAGVSRNVYNQFNVGANGAILNNSRTAVQTQLGGYVQGNPFLATGPARIILNEVNGGTPSQLRGYIEVAGQRAEVVIANPAGISVDGGGFINASRATLTTGTPQFNALGSLDSFLVRGGTVTIDGAGLDARTTDYAAVLARAVQLNAAIYATELKVVTGANQISADQTQITPTQGTGAAPTFALDVAALGGMYAGKIVLLGTEQGLGVRNAGNIGASAGSLVVTASGRLENTGTLEGQSVQLTSTGSDIVNQGTIRQTSMVALALAAPTVSNTSGGWIGSEPPPPPTSTPTAGGSNGGDTGTGTGITTSTGSSGSTGAPTSTGTTATGGTSAPAAAPIEPGSLTAAGAIRNDGGKIYAGGPITLQTENLLNNGGTLSVASLSLNQPTFSNQGGTINVSGAFTANLGTFDNSSGKLRTGSLDITTSGDLNNQDGVLSSDTDAKLTVGGSVNNLRGNISAAGALTAKVSGATVNTSGTLASNQGLTLNTGSLDNTQGSIQSAQSGVQVTATGHLVNGNGSSINTATDLSINAATLTNAGTLRGANDVNVTVSGALVNDGNITAGRNTTITAASVESGAAGVLGAGIQSDGTLGSTGDLRVTSTRALTANGTNLAAGNATLQGASVDLSAGKSSGSNIAITATQSDINTGNKAVISTPGMLSITAAGALSNVEGTLGSNGGTTVNAASLDNTSGAIAAVAGDLRVTTTGTTDNTSGSLLASGAVVLANDGLTNIDGKASGSSLAVDTHNAVLDNTRGTLTASTTVDVKSGALKNDGGLIQSGGAMSINTNGQSLSNTNAAGYSNQQGGIVSGDTLTLKTGGVNNTGGFIGSKNALSGSTGAFVNADAGMVLSQSTLSINTQGTTYDNRNGQTLAVGDLQVDASALQNSGGLIRSSATTTLRTGSLDNTATSSADQGIEGKNVAITAATADNTTGAIRAATNATLTSTGRVENGTGGLISAGDTLAVADSNADTPAAKTSNVVNAGTLLAGSTLIVDTASLSSSGKLLSQGNMHLALTQDVTMAAGSETIANRDLSLTTSGNLSNSGRIAAGKDLSLSAANIDNTATGDIQGTTTRLSASGTVTNRGVIDGVVTRIDAGTVTNIGTGRIYGDHVSIGAGTLNNQAETANGSTSAATIAARQRLDIGAGTVNNQDGALIFSDGDISIGGGLNTAGQATGVASSINNHAATIEATGNVSIIAATLNNTNGGVTWTLQPGDSKQVVEYTLPGSSTRYKADEVLISFGGFQPFPDTGWYGWTAASAANPLTAGSNPYARLLVPSPEYPLARFRTYYMQSPESSQDRSIQECTVGQDSTCKAVPVPGVWFPRTDPIWATFGVTPPAVDFPLDFIGRRYPLAVGQQSVVTGQDLLGRDIVVTLDHPFTQAESDQWQAYLQAHSALDKATLKFIHTIAGYTELAGTEYEPGRMASTYDAYVYTVTTSTPVLQSSAPGKIIAGGAMSIAVGSGVNDMSQILAGGALTVTGGTIVNKGLTVDAPTVQTGTVSHSYVEAHNTSDDVRVYQIAPYNLTTNSTATLAAARQEGNVTVAVGNPGTGSLSVGQTGAGAQAAGGVSGSTRVNPIIQVQANSGPSGTKGVSGATVVRTSVPNVGIPSASLFRTLADPSSRYLIETDPRFANYRNWLSSDYLLNNLGLDPNTTLKRLGDGFYEERLIREQVAQLTGYRYLDGFTDDDAQYTALMNAGAAFAQQYGLRVGVALTAAQMAQLTSDIVWLVEQTVTLPDGSTQRVLVPQVYVRVKPGDIDGSGAVLSGGSVDMRFSGDLTNAGGTIAGRHVVSLSADNINNLAGRITGEDVTLKAKTDINVIGAVVDASKSLTAIAGRDINVVTTTRDSKSDTGPLARSSADSGVNLSATTLDRVAGLYVTNPGGSLNVAAVRDANLIGAEVKSAGDVSVTAGRDVNIGTVTTGRKEDIRWSSDNTRKDETSKEIGSTISGAGNVSIDAGRNLTGIAVTMNAGETLRLNAGDKLTLSAGENSGSATTTDAQKDGLSHSSANADGQETSLERSTFTAKVIQMHSGGDMTLSAIEANAETMGIDAGGKLNLLTQKTTSAFSGSETDGDGAWVSAKSGGHKDETSQYNLFNVQNLNIKAGGGVTAQVGQNDSLAVLAQQPGMAWVNQLANDPAFANSVEWQRVQEEHKKWAQSQTNLGPVAAIVVSVVVGMVAGPVAGQAGNAVGGTVGVAAGEGVALAGGGAFLTGTGLTISAGVSAAVQAGITALATQATVSFINNDGDIGKVLDELGSSQGVKNIATAMVTAGVLQGLSNALPENIANATNGSAKFTDQLQRQLIDGTASALVRSAINGTSLEDELSRSLTNALWNTVAAQGANAIGDLTQGPDAQFNGLVNKIAHAIAGCAVGAGRANSGSGCAPGALGAVVGELTAEMAGRTDNTVEMAGLMATLAVAIAGGDERQLNIAMSAGSNAAANNYLNHDQWAEFAKELKSCGGEPICESEKRTKYADIGKKQDAALAVCDKAGNCDALKKEVEEGRKYQIELVKNKELPAGYLGAFDLQQLGLKMANQPAYREQVGKSVVAQMMCQLDQKQCDIESAKMAAGLGLALVGGPAAAYLFSSLPAIAAAAQMSIAACSANPRLCANQAGLVVTDLIGAEALGGSSIAGGALAAKALGKIEAEADAARLLAQRETTIKLPNPVDGTANSPYSSGGVKYGNTTATDAAGNALPTLPSLPTVKANPGAAAPIFSGSGPAPGVIAITDTSSVNVLKTYTPSGRDGIEFVFDPTTMTFAVGKPRSGLFEGSPHQQLAQSIGANDATVVGGTFSRAPDGSIITTENSGHYGQNWTPETWKKFQDWLSNRLGTPVNHQPWNNK